MRTATLRHQNYTTRRGLSLPRLLALMVAARRQRDSLATLSPHMLRDIGVSSNEALKEAARPLWDVPRTWLR